MPCHYYFKSVFFISFLFLTGCQSFQYDPWPDTGEGVYHTVQKDQTLYRIAKAYELDVEVLQRANHIGDPSKLKGNPVMDTRSPQGFADTRHAPLIYRKKENVTDCQTP